MAEKEAKLVGRWLDRIHTSKRWMDQVADEANWETFISEYKGKYDVVIGNVMVPPIAEVYAYIQSSIANLFFQNPYITVNPAKTSTIAGAVIWEAVLNSYWRKLKIKDEVELEIIDSLLVGHSWNKVGINVKTSGSGDQMRLESDQVFSNRISWRDMRMNVGTRRPTRDNLWIAQRIYRPTDDIKKDYGKAASKISGSAHPSIDEKYRKNVLYVEDINFSALYEVWDARERKIYLLADENSTEFLEDPRDWPDYITEFPFQFLGFNDVPDEPYPMSDIAPWNPQILEKIKIFTQALNHIKRWNRQMVAKKGTFSPSELDKFEKGIDGAILLASTTGDIQTAIRFVDFGQLPPDIYMILDRLDQLIRKTNGQPEFEQGANTKTGTRTLGELNLIKSGSNSRTERKIDRIEKHCEAIARQLKAHLENHFVMEEFVKITGKEPPEIIAAFKDQGIFDPVTQTIRFTPDMIKGEYDVTIKQGSTLPLDKMTRDQILDSVLQTAVPLSQSPTLPPFVAEIIKERLHDYDIKGLEAAFDAQLGQSAQMGQMSAMEKQTQTAKTAAETKKREAQANQINVNTELTTAQAVGKATGLIHPEMDLVK